MDVRTLDRFESNYEVAYELGLLDALSIAYRRSGAQARVIDIPVSLTKAVAARYTTPVPDVVHAATLSQRAIEETTNTAGSLADFVITQVRGDDGKVQYRWMPSATATITGRTTEPVCPCYSSHAAAAYAASTFMRTVGMRVCQFATARDRKAIQNTVSERYRQIVAHCRLHTIDTHCIVMGQKGMFLVAALMQANAPDFMAAMYIAVLKACCICLPTDGTVLVKYVGQHAGQAGRLLYIAIACNAGTKSTFRHLLTTQLQQTLGNP